MAIFDGKNLKGSIGNLVFSQHGKKTVVKSKPGVGGVRQTAATKRVLLYSANILVLLPNKSDLHLTRYIRVYMMVRWLTA